MAQDILITPGSGEPQILFRGSGTTDTAIELNVLSSFQSATGSGTALTFEGTQGQLFGITDNLSSGTIFSVSDITGLPTIEVDASGDVKLAEFGRDIIAYKPITLESGVPSVTTDKLYNDGYGLYFNGSAVGGGTSYTAGSGILIDGSDKINVYGGSGNFAAIQIQNGEPTAVAETIYRKDPSGIFFGYNQIRLNNFPDTREVFNTAVNTNLYTDPHTTFNIGSSNSTRWYSVGRDTAAQTTFTGVGELFNPQNEQVAVSVDYSNSNDYNGTLSIQTSFDGSSWTTRATVDTDATTTGTASFNMDSGQQFYLRLIHVDTDAEGGDTVNITSISIDFISVPNTPNEKSQIRNKFDYVVFDGSGLWQGNTIASGDRILARKSNPDGSVEADWIIDRIIGWEPSFYSVELEQNAATTTTNSIYNSGGSLYFNGSAVGGGGGTTYTAGSGITIDDDDKINVYGGSGHFQNIQLETTGIEDALLITSTDPDSEAGPVISTMRDSASPADGDYLGQLKFKGRSDTGAERVYAKITGKTLDVTNGTEDGVVEFMVRADGSNKIISRFRNDGLRILNDGSLLIQDAGNVGIRNTNPSYPLDVEGDAHVASGLLVGDTLDVSGVATFDQVVTFQSGVKANISSSPDSATVVFDMDRANSHMVTLGGNRALTVTNVDVGQKFMIRLEQDSTGSRTVTWWNNIKWAEGGTEPTLTTTGGKADIFGFLSPSGGYYDGFVVGQNI